MPDIRGVSIPPLVPGDVGNGSSLPAPSSRPRGAAIGLQTRIEAGDGILVEQNGAWVISLDTEFTDALYSGGGGGIPEAPIDGNPYVRQDASWIVDTGGGGGDESFTQDGTGAVLRTQTEKLKEIISAKDFGAVGDGVTDDQTAIAAAWTASGGYGVTMPAGLYVYGASAFGAALGAKRLVGPGRVQHGGNKRAPFFTAISAPPSSFGNPDSVDTAFNGDVSKVQFAVEHRITGATTLSQPTSGYAYTNEAYPHYTYLYNSSGYNHETDGNEGRTAAVAHRTKVVQAGQGDCVAYNATGFVSGTKVGATHFLAQPAASLFNGGIEANTNYVYLNAGEMILIDNGFDVSAIGWVVNLDRDNATGGQDCYWAGHRVQSKGAQPIDDAYFASGKVGIGLNLLAANLGTDKAAIALTANSRIYGNAAFVDPQFFQPPTLGTEYFSYSSANSGWSFAVGGGTVTIGDNWVNIPHDTAPASPANGDIWTTTAGLFARIDGASVAYAPLASPTFTGTVTTTTTQRVRQAVTATASTTINRLLGDYVDLTMSANITTFAVSNWPAAGTMGQVHLALTFTGAFTITWPAAVKWPGGTPPTLTGVAGKADHIMLVSDDGGTTIWGFVMGQNYDA